MKARCEIQVCHQYKNSATLATRSEHLQYALVIKRRDPVGCQDVGHKFPALSQAKIKVQVGKAPMSSPDINYGSLSPLDEGPFHDINAQFVLNSGYLVFFMHCGFAMVRNEAASYGPPPPPPFPPSLQVPTACALHFSCELCYIE